MVGPRDCDADTYRLAREVGRLLGGAGVVVATGGGSGVMEAAARGANDAGAQAIGFLPGTDTGGANPYLSVAVATGLGEGRNALLVTASRAVIAVGGSWGTESEIAFAVRTGTPVVSLGGWARVDADGHPVEGVAVRGRPGRTRWPPSWRGCARRHPGTE